jgi:hypothetical protein
MKKSLGYKTQSSRKSSGRVSFQADDKHHLGMRGSQFPTNTIDLTAQRLVRQICDESRHELHYNAENPLSKTYGLCQRVRNAATGANAFPPFESPEQTQKTAT